MRRATFSTAEVAYLTVERRLGRLATADRGGDMVPSSERQATLA